MVERKPLSKKILVLGIDGMDARLSQYHMSQGHMPNLAKLVARGAARADLEMLGAHPTITPPMWTTLATGAFPMTHGITDFWRQNPERPDTFGYNLDSRMCQAEQLWNVFAEAGKKTLVWHWPGSSWPPTSDSPNLHVVDGTQPEGVNMGTAQVEGEYIAAAATSISEVTFRNKVGNDSHMCVITDLETAPADEVSYDDYVSSPDITNIILDNITAPDWTNTILDASLSPIKPAVGWAAAPEGALEFTILFSKGLIRRMALLLPNAEGIYDHLAIYKSKKDLEPMVTLANNEFGQDVLDEAIKNDIHYEVTRNMRVLDIAPDGSQVRMWISAAMNIHDDTVWHPKALFEKVTSNVGYPQPASNLGFTDKQLIVDCMEENWMRTLKWQADAINFLIEEEDYDVVFSHVHNDDGEKHMFLAHCKENPSGPLTTEEYLEILLNVSRQNDYYIGRFLPLLDQGWTILLVSDHGLVCPKYHASDLLAGGIVVEPFRSLGYLTLVKDENGNDTKQIDWSKTRAVMSRMNMVYVNQKGRFPTGIVEPEDVEDLVQELITALYNYRDSVTGKRSVALAFRNRDAKVIGLGGPECGDIIYFTTEGYNDGHGDSLSTTHGESHTSTSPIFVAAGSGIKSGFITDRIILEVDVAPSVAVLGGVRFPYNCEGAPVYQIFASEI